MASPYRKLIITDGTIDTSGLPREVDLLSATTGFHLTSWESGVSELKGGGVWSDSALSDGRQLQLAKASNTTHTMTLEVLGFDTDDVAKDTQTLRQLLLQARQYWLARWAVYPVYIEAQAVNESNTRYIEIKNWSTPRGAGVDENTLWTGILQAGISDFDLILECGPYWKDHPPGESDCLEIGAMQSWQGTYYGNYNPNTSTREETCSADTVYVANKHNMAQLTHCFFYNDATTTYSANLLTTSLTYTLLPAAPGAWDRIYCGIDTSVTNSGPFASVVFDLASAGTGISFSSSGGLGRAYWQYWDSTAVNWKFLYTQDNTNNNGLHGGEPFDTAGPRSVHWQQPATWGANMINGTTAFWVRCTVLNTAMGATPPVQQNRHPYTIVWPYAEIRADKIAGDVPSLLRLYLKNRTSGGSYSAGYPVFNYNSDRWIVGLRSLSRGDNFTAYLNASDEQNPTGVDFGNPAGIVNDMTAPTGRSYTYGGAVIDWTVDCYWNLLSVICNEFFGTYHAYLRVRQTAGSTGDIGVRLYATAMGTYNASDAVYSSREDWTGATVTDIDLLDLGQITLPPGHILSTEDVTAISLYTEIKCLSASAYMTIYDLILMPVDEMSTDAYEIESSSLAVSMNLDYSMLVDLDSVSTLKWPKRAVRRVAATDRTYGTYMMVGPGELFVQTRAHQRLWFLSTHYQVLAQVGQPHISLAHSVQAWNVQRYYDLRGGQ